MYVLPNTDIRLCRGVPIYNTYQDTLYFEDASDQYNYFNSKVAYAFNPTTYQRVGKNSLRIQLNATSCYDLNYMMFVNVRDGANKWWYAFITNVEYINENTTEIRYEIDVMQSYMFDYHYEHCFVAREHVGDDTIGAHLEPEPVAVGEYKYNGYKKLVDLKGYCVIVSICNVEKGDKSNGNWYDGVYSGSRLYYFDSTSTKLDDFLGDYIQKPDAITGIYMVPELIAGNHADGDELHSGTKGFSQEIDGQTDDVNYSYEACNTDMTLDGYKPRNNKLYTYPYNYFAVDNSNGSSLSLRYEFFKDLRPRFILNGTVTAPVELMIRPEGYKGTYDYGTLKTETLTITSFPMCSWNYDAFKAWWAQNAVPTAINIAGSAASTALGAYPLNHVTQPAGLKASQAVNWNTQVAESKQRYAVGAGQDLIGTIASTLSTAYSASIAADNLRGNFNNGGVNVSSDQQCFYGGRCSITKDRARIIDEFFDMFGYQVNRVKIPNTHSRPRWNYVQTRGCNIIGNVPSDDIAQICTIHDNGITFWKNPDDVGRYDLDNKVVQE